MTDEEEFPLSLKREWKPPKFQLEFLWIEGNPSFKELQATFRTTPNLELVAVGDTLWKEENYRQLTLVFREVEKPIPARKAFSLKKEWELSVDGTQTLDTIKDENMTFKKLAEELTNPEKFKRLAQEVAKEEGYGELSDDEVKWVQTMVLRSLRKIALTEE